MSQMQIDFTPGLLEQWPDFKALLINAALSCGKQMKVIAADLDWSPSEFSKRLYGELPFPVDKLPAFIESTGDTRIVQWQVLRFMGDPRTEHERALQQLAALAPMFSALCAKAGFAVDVVPPTKGQRR